MYDPDTILELKEQHEPNEETGEEFAYNRVKVVGPSPISHGGAGEWSGVSAQGVIITPLANFGSTLDEPLGKLQALYDVVETPVRETVTQVTIPVRSPNSQGPTPEEVFAKEAPGDPDAPRRPSHVSPLKDPRPKGKKGPLDK